MARRAYTEVELAARGITGLGNAGADSAIVESAMTANLLIADLARFNSEGT
jgi:hypothetical protein